MKMTDSERKAEMRWHNKALAHALERRDELMWKHGGSLPRRELLMEYIDRLDEDIRWHEGRMRELEAAGI